MRGFTIKDYMESNPNSVDKNAVIDANIFYRSTNTDYRENIFEGKLSDLPAYLQDVNCYKAEDSGDSIYFKASINVDTH